MNANANPNATKNKEEDYDFGFTLIDEGELKLEELNIISEVRRKSEDAEKSVQKEKTVNKKLMDAILPLLQNLMKDDGKDYIFWPNRKEKLQEFIDKLNRISNGN